MNSSAVSNIFPSSLSATAVTDVYTDLNGMQQLRNEGDKEQALKKVAQQFESLFIHMMLKNMRNANAVFEKDSIFNSKETEFYRDMHDHQLSLTLAHQKGIGIADALYRQMSRVYGAPDQSGNALPTTERLVNSVKPHSPEYLSAIPSASDEELKINAKRSAIANSPLDFVEKLMSEFSEVDDTLGVDPQYLVAQAALETGWGQKVIADKNGLSSNNLFNIKSSPDWTGDSVSIQSLEFENGHFKPQVSEFRRYESIKESVEDYINFIKSSGRYQGALQATENGFDYITELQSAGYATDPDYAQKVLAVYQQISSNQFSENKGS